MGDIRAEITDSDDASGRWLYAWSQVETDVTTGADADPLSRLSGTLTENPAVEINDTEVAVGTVVHLRERGFVDGQMWYEFQHTPALAALATATKYRANTSYSVTADSTWEDTGASFTLGVGTYLITFKVCFYSYLTTLPAGLSPALIARLYDTTSSAAVAGSYLEHTHAAPVNTAHISTLSAVFVVTIASGTHTVRVEGWRSGGGGIVWALPIIGQGLASEGISIQSVKVG